MAIEQKFVSISDSEIFSYFALSLYNRLIELQELSSIVYIGFDSGQYYHFFISNLPQFKVAPR